ncbi:hypothetical protein Y1Q_0008863 [Alligator mississippiensis]|uniref:Uncharacterized protein n=1 Tax=Alligator mississippiensis TaxID=8496 RepID=A0A151NAH4_ALLMI|nr:hypothetical protein Y1Q_0008863 [Alligator mississippiensis]
MVITMFKTWLLEVMLDFQLLALKSLVTGGDLGSRFCFKDCSHVLSKDFHMPNVNAMYSTYIRLSIRLIL